MSAISKSQNFVQLLASRELGAQVPLFSDQNFLIQNIKEGNYTKTIFDGREPGIIKTFDVQDDFAATVGDIIQLWNLKMGQCLWTFDPRPKVYWNQMIKIVEGNIICAGVVEIPESNEYNNTIRIIDLQTGVEKAAITDSELEVNKICAIGRRIFSVLQNGNIGEWNFNGKFVRLIFSGKGFGSGSALFGSENFLVRIFNYNIMIYDIKEKSSREVGLNRGKMDISSVHIDGTRLICGFSTYEKINKSNFCVIDLKNGAIIDQYQAKEAFVHTALDIHSQPYLTENGIVWNVVANQGWIYFGHTTGKVVAVNLVEKKHVVLGEHRSFVHHLVVEGQVLISGSAADGNFTNQLKFWDVESMKEIATMELPGLIKISFVAGKLVAAIGRSLVQWDYLVSHKGERISKIDEILI